MKSELEGALESLQFKVIAGLCFLIVFAVTFTLVGVWVMVRVASDSREAHSALCTFKADLDQRYDNGVKYLKDHPEGLVTHNGEVLLTASQIKQSLDNEKSSLDSLNGLSCP